MEFPYQKFSSILRYFRVFSAYRISYIWMQALNARLWMLDSGLWALESGLPTLEVIENKDEK